MKRLRNFVLLPVFALLAGCGGGPGGAGEGSGGGTTPPQGLAYTVLYTFKRGADGTNPTAGLIRDAAGNLYGTTTGEGDLACPDGFGGGCGTVFKLDSSGVLTTLHVFAGGPMDGAFPQEGLVRDASGNLYGTTGGGGKRTCVQGCGTVFMLDATGNETVLHFFTGGADGSGPELGVRDPAGNLYGTTQYGGDLSCSLGCGTVFKLDAAGHLTTLHAFTGLDGQFPHGHLIQDGAGNFYGTTAYGGDLACQNGCGTVFKLFPSGTFATLHRFAGFPTDGEVPSSGLTQDASGNLYGTTIGGGARFGGTVFHLDSSDHATILHSFTQPEDEGFDDPGGQDPNGLLPGATGNLYGTTSGGGVSRWGVIFRLNVQSAVKTVLYTFSGKADGGQPFGTLVADGVGNLYGTSFAGGDLTCKPPTGCGVVFKLRLP